MDGYCVSRVHGIAGFSQGYESILLLTSITGIQFDQGQLRFEDTVRVSFAYFAPFCVVPGFALNRIILVYIG